MTDRDRCTDTNPHPAHRTQYGGFGLKDCPGVPMTSREELRAERVTTGRLEGNLRSQTRAVREALAERDRARRELDTMTEVARGNKRHVAYLTAALEAINALHQPFTRGGEQWCTECSQRDGERFHFLAVWPCATHKAIDLTVPPAVLGSPRRAQEEPVMVPLAGWGGGHSRVPAPRAEG